MNWTTLTKFNFTWAMPDGAWLEDAAGHREWVSFKLIVQQLGQLWLDRQLRRQGWMTGCWVEVVK